jgi:ABC-type glutathione transport system ATPase component
MTLLSVRNLRVAFGAREVVHGLSFDLARGERLAVVGESGSGKSATALALMGLLGRGGAAGGQALLQGLDILTLPPAERLRLRGARLGMVFQEPMTALNPVLTIGEQMTEALVAHGRCGRGEAGRRAATMLDRVGVADAARRLSQYPHEFSGGMRQRVMIAAAMLLRPDVLIADEPTTALDVTVQAQILDLMTALCAEAGAGLILITHDMGVVAETADRVVVMRHGAAVESGPVGTIFAAPRADYTRALLAAVPRLDGPSVAPAPPVAGPPALALTGVRKTFGARGLFGSGTRTVALDDVSLTVARGEVLALVGESGSGKSTLGRIATRLETPDAGQIIVGGVDFGALSGAALRRARRRVQMVFQDPYASLDPRATVGASVAEPMIVHGLARGAAARAAAAALLRRVGLDGDAADRTPDAFSGGQRQRIAIARALAAEPEVIVADEPTSALDVSIQAQVLALLDGLRRERGLGMLFITHDLAVVRRIADRVAVMRRGRIVEMGPASAVLDGARHPYTRALIAAAPVPDPARRDRPRPTPPQDGAPAGPLAEAAPGWWVAA